MPSASSVSATTTIGGIGSSNTNNTSSNLSSKRKQQAGQVGGGNGGLFTTGKKRGRRQHPLHNAVDRSKTLQHNQYELGGDLPDCTDHIANVKKRISLYKDGVLNPDKYLYQDPAIPFSQLKYQNNIDHDDRPSFVSSKSMTLWQGKFKNMGWPQPLAAKIQAPVLNPKKRIMIISPEEAVGNIEREKRAWLQDFKSIAQGYAPRRRSLEKVDLNRRIFQVPPAHLSEPITFQDSKASVSIQRSWRGFQARRYIWGYNGPGYLYLTVKVQTRIRMYLARQELARRIAEKLYKMARRIQALFRGYVGRIKALQRRVERTHECALIIQCAIRVSWACRKTSNLRYWRNFRCAIYAQTAFRRHISKIQSRHLAIVAEEDYKNLRKWRALLANGKIFEQVLGNNANGIAPDFKSITQATAFLFSDTDAYESAMKLCDKALIHYPLSPVMIYIKAILYQTVWRAFGFLKVPRPDIFEEAMYLLRHARLLDGPERCSFHFIERSIFMASIKSHQNSKNLFAYALCLQSIYSSFPDEKNENKVNLKLQNSVHKRVKNIYKRSIKLDPDRRFIQVRENSEMFDNYFACKWDKVRFSRVRKFQIGTYEEVRIKIIVQSTGDLLTIKGEVIETHRKVRAAYADEAWVTHPLQEVIIQKNEIKELTDGCIEYELQRGASESWLREKHPLDIAADVIGERCTVIGKMDQSLGHRRLIVNLATLSRRRNRVAEDMNYDYAIRKLQRSYRGFMGRARYHRLNGRREMQRQTKDKNTRLLNEIKAYRSKRFLAAAKIQGIIRGVLWRAQLKRLNHHAHRIQATFRVYRLKLLIIQEMNRKFTGPAVIEMFSGGHTVTKVPLMLRVFRCGNNYKFIGQDESACSSYTGFVYSQQVTVLVNEYNKDLERKKAKLKAKRKLQAEKQKEKERIKQEKYAQKMAEKKKASKNGRGFDPDEMSDDEEESSDDDDDDSDDGAGLVPLKMYMFDDVVQLLMGKLSLVDVIQAVTWELSRIDCGKCLIIHPVYGADTTGKGISTRDSMRLLRDQKYAIEDYNKREKKKQDLLIAKGLEKKVEELDPYPLRLEPKGGSPKKKKETKEKKKIVADLKGKKKPAVEKKKSIKGNKKKKDK